MERGNKGCLITLSVIVIIGIISGLVTDIYTGFGIILLLGLVDKIHDGTRINIS